MADHEGQYYVPGVPVCLTLPTGGLTGLSKVQQQVFSTGRACQRTRSAELYGAQRLDVTRLCGAAWR